MYIYKNINSFTITSTLKADKDIHNTWQILTDYELKIPDPAIINVSFSNSNMYDINNLASFNDNI